MPSIKNYICERNPVEVEVYYYYVKPWDFTEKTYFDAITMMLTPINITLNGNKVLKLISFFQWHLKSFPENLKNIL